MVCRSVSTPGGVAIVCGPRPRRAKCRCCGRPADLLCDWKVPGRKSGTCDAPICDRCTTSPAPDKDLCPAHAAEFEAWKLERANSGPRQADEIDAPQLRPSRR